MSGTSTPPVLICSIAKITELGFTTQGDGAQRHELTQMLAISVKA